MHQSRWLLLYSVIGGAVSLALVAAVLSRASSLGPATPSFPQDHPSAHVRSLDPVERGEAIGKLLRSLRPGMTRREVERLIGPPTVGMGKSFDGATGSVGYRCRPPELIPGDHWMRIDYDLRGPEPRFIQVSGPDKPGDEPLPQDHPHQGERVGKVLRRLQAGVPRAEVERLIGVPDIDIDAATGSKNAQTVVSYWCLSREMGPGYFWVMVHYDNRGPIPRYVKTEGPDGDWPQTAP